MSACFIQLRRQDSEIPRSSAILAKGFSRNRASSTARWRNSGGWALGMWNLLGLGHRRIGAIAGPGDYLCSRARIDGYRSALERGGVRFDPALVRHGDFQHEGGFIRGGELLSLPERPTAIFAGGDQQAFGVYEAARRCGLRIPQDLSVVGFDDLPVARWVSPPLTTVRQPLAEMGGTAAQMLGELIEGLPLRSSRVELSTELIVRERYGSATSTYCSRTMRSSTFRPGWTAAASPQ